MVEETKIAEEVKQEKIEANEKAPISTDTKKAEGTHPAKEKTHTDTQKAPHREFRPRYERQNDYPEQKDSKPIFVKKRNNFPGYKMFNKWDTSEVVINDLGLARYVNLDTVIIPHTFGRKSQGKFAKADINVVERLINKIMRSGQGKRKLSGKYIRGRGSCGKKLQCLQIVERAFSIIETKTKKNPVQVLVDAIENAAPREDVTRIKKGGVAYSLAVDVSPIRRLDDALKNIALAGFGGSFNKKVSAEEALAEEIIACAAGDQKSSATKRREEVERIAKASR